MCQKLNSQPDEPDRHIALSQALMVKNSFAFFHHSTQMLLPSESRHEAGHSLSEIKCLFTKQKALLFIYLFQT